MIDIHITIRNIKYYQKQGYSDIVPNNILCVKAEDLPKGSHYKVKVKCDYCGTIINVAYRDYCRYKYDKYSCQKCRQRKTSEYNLSQRQQSLYDRALAFCDTKGYKMITPIKQVKTANTIIEYLCPKHGIHKTKIYTLLSGHGCLDCMYEENANNHRKNSDEVEKEFALFDGILLNKNEYLSWNVKNLKVLCKCGEVFTTSYSSFMSHNGQVCPKCSIISKGERAISNWLKEHNIDYQAQYRFDDCRTSVPLPFDFYLPKYNLCIEYDGEGHYKPINRGGFDENELQKQFEQILNRDNIKTDYCQKHNIDLLRIPYWEYDNVESIIKNKIFT